MFPAPPTHNTSEWQSVRKLLPKTKILYWREVIPLRSFGNGSATWSLTKHRPALGAKYVGHQSSAEQETPPTSSTISKCTTPQSSLKAWVCAVSLPSWCSQQPSPTATQTSEVQQPTIVPAFSVITPYTQRNNQSNYILYRYDAYKHGWQTGLQEANECHGC